MLTVYASEAVQSFATVIKYENSPSWVNEIMPTDSLLIFSYVSSPTFSVHFIMVNRINKG